MRRCVGRVLCRYRLEVCTEVGCLRRLHVLAREWRIGQWLSPAQQHRSHGRVALPVLKAGYDRSVGCASDGGAEPDHPASRARWGLVRVQAAARLRVDQERDRHWADSARVGDWRKYESAVGTIRWRRTRLLRTGCAAVARWSRPTLRTSTNG